MYRRTLTACALVLFVLGADKDGPKVQDKELEGVWESVSAVADGMEVPPLTGAVVMTFKGNTFTCKAFGKTETGSFNADADPTKTPKTINLKSVDEDTKGRFALAIYEVKDDTLRLCIPGFGKTRPTEIAAPKGSGRGLLTFKRVKRIEL